MCGLSNFLSVLTLSSILIFAYLFYVFYLNKKVDKIEVNELRYNPGPSNFKVKIDKDGGRELLNYDIILSTNDKYPDKISFGPWKLLVNNVSIIDKGDDYIIFIKMGRMLILIKNLDILSDISEKILNLDYYSNAFIIMDDRVVPGATFYKNMQLYGSFVIESDFISIVDGRKHFISDMAFQTNPIKSPNMDYYSLGYEWDHEFDIENATVDEMNEYPSAPPNEEYTPIYTFNKEVDGNEVFGVQNDSTEFSLIRNKPNNTARVKDLIKGIFK